jgi:hypothetical protein
LNKLPEGRLWRTYQEDGDTSTTPIHYGYWSDPASTNPKIKDQYNNAKGEVDQASGYRYEGSDTPYAVFPSASGTLWDIELNFYSEIQLKGKTIQRRYWTPIKGRFVAS